MINVKKLDIFGNNHEKCKCLIIESKIESHNNVEKKLLS